MKPQCKGLLYPDKFITVFIGLMSVLVHSDGVHNDDKNNDDKAVTDHMQDVPHTTLSRIQLYSLALASAVVTANAYYIHPIVSLVAEDFGVGPALIGAVPALNQLALAFGIFFLLPLGDTLGNAKLAGWFSFAQFVGVAIMALAGNFLWFIIGSTLLGLFTITPYLIPAYVSKRTNPANMGHSIAVLTTGIILGILSARLGAGLIGEYLGWRNVYYIASALMLIFSFAMPYIMRQPKANKAAPTRRNEQDDMRYGPLLLSTLTIAIQHKQIILSGIIQGLNFGIFLAAWLGIGLHLPRIGYGADTVGYLTIMSIINLASTPMLGRWMDKIGARRTRLIMAALQIIGTSLLFFSGGQLWWLLLPLIIMNMVSPTIDVAGRATFLTQTPEIRTRLMTVYIMLMFLGGGVASWAGTVVYAAAGWTGTGILVCAMACTVLLLCLWGERANANNASAQKDHF